MDEKDLATSFDHLAAACLGPAHKEGCRAKDNPQVDLADGGKGFRGSQKSCPYSADRGTNCFPPDATYVFRHVLGMEPSDTRSTSLYCDFGPLALSDGIRDALARGDGMAEICSCTGSLERPGLQKFGTLAGERVEDGV